MKQIAPLLSTVIVGTLTCILLLCSSNTGASDCTAVVITDQPRSQAVLEGCSAAFSVGVTGDSPYFFQWWRDGQPVPGETNSSYMVAVARFSDAGARVYVTISNGCSQTSSAVASLYIALDVVQPRLLRARGDTTLERVIVSFSVGTCGWPGLDSFASQDPYNYSFSGGIVASNALLDATGTNVILSTSRQTPGTIYTLVVNDVFDRNGNRIPPDSQTEIQAWIPLPGSDPPTNVPPPVSISRSGGAIFITRPPGSLLQQAERITGPWSTLSDPGDPHRTSGTNTGNFFRAFFFP